MIVRIITVYIKKGKEQLFMDATIKNHEESLKEPGVKRFDFLRDNENHSVFYLYEAYVSSQAADDHKKTGHYIIWKDTVAPLLDGDRERIAATPIVPQDDLW